MNYSDVYHLIWNRPHKRRHGVLGKWREIKLQQWAEHVELCGAAVGVVERPAPLRVMVADGW